MSVIHRVRLPRGAQPAVEAGQTVQPDDVLATHRPPGPAVRVPVAARLRRPPAKAADDLVVAPGSVVEAGEAIARHGRREVQAPSAGLLLAYEPEDGSVLLGLLGEPVPIVGHVRGEVISVSEAAVEIRIPGAVLDGVGGLGDAVHGELVMGVHDPSDELRASAIDAGATGKIVVGGSRASAETLIRARAMGVAGIVLGGVLDKELRDFEAIQRRRREVGGVGGTLGLLLLEGFGKVGLDPLRFEWFRAHDGRMASLFGTDRRLYVYEAGPPPVRGTAPMAGERVIAHRRPFAGRAGSVVRVLPELHAAPSGIPVTTAIVAFEDGRTAAVPLANLETTGPAVGG